MLASVGFSRVACTSALIAARRFFALACAAPPHPVAASVSAENGDRGQSAAQFQARGPRGKKGKHGVKYLAWPRQDCGVVGGDTVYQACCDPAGDPDLAPVAEPTNPEREQVEDVIAGAVSSLQDGVDPTVVFQNALGNLSQITVLVENATGGSENKTWGERDKKGNFIYDNLV